MASFTSCLAWSSSIPHRGWLIEMNFASWKLLTEDFMNGGFTMVYRFTNLFFRGFNMFFNHHGDIEWDIPWQI